MSTFQYMKHELEDAKLSNQEITEIMGRIARDYPHDSRNSSIPQEEWNAILREAKERGKNKK